MAVLDFERPIVELEKKVEEMRLSFEAGKCPAKDLQRAERKLQELRERVFKRLTRWEKVQLARHLDRPHTVDYLEGMLEEFLELHGDRMGHDDPAVVGGIGRLRGMPLVVVGHEKGRTLQQRAQRNFGMPHPEGNRKALRLMALAARFKRPLLALVDTPGAYPGVEAEARGQAVSISENLMGWAMLKTPSVAVVIGEGGSGGALAMGMADRVLMMEHAIYSVISPEGCAAILWRDEGKKDVAAEALKLTAEDALRMGLIDEIVAEPLGGAHRDHEAAVKAVGEACHRHLLELSAVPLEELFALRYERYRRMGVFMGEADQGQE